MKKILLLGLMVLGSFSSFASDSRDDRCMYIGKKLTGRYNVTLLKHDGDKIKAGKVSFTKTANPYIFKASNLVVIGDILLPGAPKKIALTPVEGECLLVGMGKVENNTLGSIIEGQGMRAFSVAVDDETFESVSFTKY